MKRVPAAAVLAAVAAVGLALRASAQERIATNDTYNEFPRWTMLVNAFNAQDGSGNRVLPGNISLAQDLKNVIHLAGTLGVSGGGNQVFHTHNGPMSRRGNGYSAPYQVSSLSSGQSVTDVEAVALSDGRVIVFWVQPGTSGNDIRWRERSAAGSWGSVQSGLTGASGDVLSNLRATASGTSVHMVFVRTNGSSVKLEYVNPTTSWTPTTVSDKAVTSSSAAGANIAVDGSGNLHVAYEDYPNGGGENGCIRTSTNGGSTWSSATTIAADAYSPDVATDSGGNAHIVYIKGAGANSGKVYHQIGAGSPTHIGNTTAAAIAFDRSRILVDKRDRPNVMWSTNGDVGYAVKVGSSWTRQEPIQEPTRGNLGSGRGTNSWSFGPLDVVINPFDGVSWVETTGGLGSSIYDPNLGSQDSTAEFAMGPGATVNGATGNLNFRLPLFTSKGVGFATSFALFHNSLEADWGVMSNGWNHNYGLCVNDGATGYNNNQDSVTVVFADGSKAIFRYSSTYGYLVADAEYGVFPKLQRLTASSSVNWANSGYRLTTKYGIQYDFREDGKLLSITDTNSNTMDFHYSGDSGFTPDSTHPAGALWQIEDSTKNLGSTHAGRLTTLNYNSDGQLASVQDPKAASATYVIAYSSGRVSTVSFTGESGIVWTFSYHTTNHAVNGYRIGLLSQIMTPRGTAAGTQYGNTYQWQQDNRFRATVDPTVTVITNCVADANPVSDSPVHELTYSDPTSGSFSTPNQSAPGSNTVPSVAYSDPCGRTTNIEYQSRRALADNVTDALSNYYALTYDGVYRNLTAYTNRRGHSTLYTYHTTTYPAHVKDNLWKIERPNTAGTGHLSPIIYTYTTDNLNRVASFADAKGNSTTYSYSSAGNLTGIAYPTTTLVSGASQSASIAITYTSRGRIDTFTDAEAGVTDYDYSDNATGLVTEVRLDGQTSGNGFVRTYDALGNLDTWANAANNAAGGTWSYSYDGVNRLETITDPLSETLTVGYDADSHITSYQDRRGNTQSFVFDARGQLTSSTIPITTSTTATSNFTYDREGHLRRESDYRGHTTVYLYDELGRLSQAVLPGGGTTGSGSSSSLVHDYTYDYDEEGNLIEIRLNGTVDRVTTLSYDARNNRIGVTLAIGSLTRAFIYDDNDNLLAKNEFESSTFRGGFAKVHDERNRVTKTYELTSAYSSGTPSGYAKSLLYDKDSRIVQLWNGRASSFGTANSISYSYDARGRLASVTNGDGNVVQEYSYYEDGTIEEIRGRGSNPATLIPVSNYEYTTRNEVSTWTDALSNTESYTYDEEGNLLTVTDRRGVVTSYAYYPTHLPSSVSTAVTVPSTKTITRSYTYDANGNPSTSTIFNPATSANNATYQWFWDKADRPEKYTSPNTMHSLVYTYDQYGDLSTSLDFNGVTIAYTYDDLGRLVTEAHGAPHNVTVSYAYHAATRLATDVDDGTQRILRVFDVRGLLTSEEWRVSSVSFKTVSYGHDGARNITSMTDPEGTAIAFTYDSDNRFYTATRAAGLQATATYDAAGRKSRLVYGMGAPQVDWTYTDRSEVASVVMSGFVGGGTAGFSYQYDARGQRTQQYRIEFQETVTWTYDDMKLKLTESSNGSGTGSPLSIPVRSISWTHDDANNTTSMTRVDPAPVGTTTVTYAFDNENNLTSESSGTVTWTYQYDANGNRTQRSSGINAETFAYDFRGRLSSYVRTVGTSTVASVTYGYMVTAQSLRMSDLLAGNSVWTMHDFSSVSTRYNQAGTGTLTLASSFLNNPAMWECHVLARFDVTPTATIYTIQDDACTEPVLSPPGGGGAGPPSAPFWPSGDNCCCCSPEWPDPNHLPMGMAVMDPPQYTGGPPPYSGAGGGGGSPPAMASKSNMSINPEGSVNDLNLGTRITPAALVTSQNVNASHFNFLASGLGSAMQAGLAPTECPPPKPTLTEDPGTIETERTQDKEPAKVIIDITAVVLPDFNYKPPAHWPQAAQDRDKAEKQSATAKHFSDGSEDVTKQQNAGNASGGQIRFNTHQSKGGTPEEIQADLDKSLYSILAAHSFGGGLQISGTVTLTPEIVKEKWKRFKKTKVFFIEGCFVKEAAARQFLDMGVDIVVSQDGLVNSIYWAQFIAWFVNGLDTGKTINKALYDAIDKVTDSNGKKVLADEKGKSKVNVTTNSDKTKPYKPEK